MSRALIQAWEKTLRRRGDDCAIIHASDGRTCTFRELDARAATWLGSQAIEPHALAGRAVVFAVSNGIPWMEMFLGLLRAGAVAVPLEASEPPSAQRRIAQELRAGYWWNGKKLVVLADSRRFRDPSVCLIKLTSGTTRRPRTLVFTDAQLLADVRQVTATMGIGVRDLNYALIPFGHSFGLGNLVLPLLVPGVPLVCGAVPLPQAIAADFARWRPTVFPSVPAVFRALAAAEIAPGAFASLRLAISAGAPLPADTARGFAARFGQPLHSFYGSSETGGIAYDATGDATLAGGVGRPMRGVRVTLLRGRRLRVCSAAVFTHGNRERVEGTGCWSPPDRADIDARGGITLLGRRGCTVKIAGRRVNLGEVAAQLRHLDGVRDVWVGVSAGAEPVLGTAIASERTAGELRAALHADTAAWKVPRKWVVMPELPLTPRGKMDTRALQVRVFK
jgi:long-chain acyl-CoA synthetase